jgi:hypothetical protein
VIEQDLVLIVRAASLFKLACWCGHDITHLPFSALSAIVRRHSSGPATWQWLAKNMAQSISRGSIRAYGRVHTTGVLAPDHLRGLADARASRARIVVGRRLRNRHDCLGNAPTVHERGSLPLLPPLEAAAPRQDAVARITAR